ncbi:MAG: LysM peptidoglycan-binding domain-containing protein [Treponema sp.]|jgi:LysM repeat protein|nr:LysM peptidoglycan-binding domain-containing protein [Treponema sp.]
MASTIGIKVANGEFYPILGEDSPVRKRLILTTVHDNQKSIQVDIYNSYAKTMADALYMGSLVVENLKPQPKGKPNIEMILSSNSSGQITADVVDLDSSMSGISQHLSVSLVDVAEDDRVNDAIPDFDLESHEHPPRGLYDKESPGAQVAQKKKFPWPLLFIAAALLLALGGLLGFFFFTSQGIGIRSGLRRPSGATAPATPAGPVQPAAVPPAPAPVAAPAQPEAVPEPPAATPVISAAQQPPRAADGEARADRTRTLPPVASYKVPQTIPRGGTPYTIRWGDTLWDISEAFYRTPWLYPRIARFNSIRNPDFIISGRTIRIPPRN